MAKVRLSTTVDADLLARARAATGAGTDAHLVEQALTELLHKHRDAEIDAAYAASYQAVPADTPDDWGDLTQWHEAVRVARAQEHG